MILIKFCKERNNLYEKQKLERTETKNGEGRWYNQADILKYVAVYYYRKEAIDMKAYQKNMSRDKSEIYEVNLY